MHPEVKIYASFNSDIIVLNYTIYWKFLKAKYPNIKFYEGKEI